MSKQEKTKKDRKKTNQATASRLSVGRGGAVREKNKNRLQEHFYNSSKHRCDSSKVMRVGFSLPTVSTATILQPPDGYGLIHRSCSNKRWGRREGARRHVPAAEDNHLNAASIHNTGIISLYDKKWQTDRERCPNRFTRQTAYAWFTDNNYANNTITSMSMGGMTFSTSMQSFPRIIHERNDYLGFQITPAAW